jgi:predicted Na+-dependent transporter
MVAAAPFALVAPLFSKKYQADATLSQLLVIVSSLIAPLATYFSLEVLGHQKLSHFSFVPISKILIILALIIISSLLLSSKMNFFTSSTWYKFQSKSSSLIIALLVYIFWGQTWPLFARRAVGVDEVIIVSIIMLFMDFGIFFLLKTVKKLTHGTESDAIRVTLSMRNLAIPATIIAAYSPSTLFIPAIGFICHILLFNYLAIAKKI